MTDPAPPLELLKTASLEPNVDQLLEIYHKNFNMSMIKFAIFTLIQGAVLYFVFAGSGIAEVARNWPKYRCSPLIMPFAGLYGHDAGENFNYCMKNVFSANASAVLGPLYGIMANFTEVIGTVSNVANSFRLLIANLLNGMQNLMSSFRDRFQTILFSIRLSFLKIQSLMGRVYSTFYAVLFMGLSAIKAADNLAHNELVTFMMEFCFIPSTPIKLANGKTVPISMLQLGDALAPVLGEKPIVTSLFQFDGKKTYMVRIGDIVVSSKHFVFYDPLGIWIEAGTHPLATPEPSHPLLYCLNTSTHTLRIGDFMFSDYDESSDPLVANEVMKMAQNILNNGYNEMPPPQKGYALGIYGSAVVRMKDDTIRSIKSLRVGEILKEGGKILGIVREQSAEIVTIPGLVRDHYVSPSQLLWDSKQYCWRRAAVMYPDRCIKGIRPFILCQLVTENNIIHSEGRTYRDYREVSDPEMEEPYAAAVQKFEIGGSQQVV
jgi:hypothetical protein